MGRKKNIARWQGHPLLLEAMDYAVRAGGKRMRPILAAATCRAFGGRDTDALDLGCSVELIHAYSLVHDDLPSMDKFQVSKAIEALKNNEPEEIPLPEEEPF